MMPLVRYELKKIRRRPLTLVVLAGCLLLIAFTIIMNFTSDTEIFYNNDIATPQNQTLYPDYEDPALQAAGGSDAQTLRRQRYAYFATIWDDEYVQQLADDYNFYINNPQNYTNQIDEFDTMVRDSYLRESGLTAAQIEEYNLQNPLYSMKRTIQYGEEGQTWDKVGWLLNRYFLNEDGSTIPIATAFPTSGGSFPFGYFNGINKALTFQTDYIGIFLALMVVAGIAPLFCEEISQNTAPLLLSARHGRTRLVHAKLISTILYCIASTVLLSGAVFLLCGLLNGFDGLNLFMQLHTDLDYSPWALTLGQYFAVRMLLQMGAAMVLGMVVALFSALLSSAFPTLLSGIVFMGANLFVLIWLRDPMYEKWAHLMPATALLPTIFMYFTQWRTFAVGPWQVPQWAFTVAIWLLVMAVCWLAISRLYKKKEV